MPVRGRVIYREWTPWPGWILVMFWGTMLLGAAFVAVAPGESEQERFWGEVVLVTVAVAVQWLVAGLRLRLYKDGLVVGLGSSGWISKRVRWEDVVRTEAVTYQPLLEFGGWGVRWGKDGKKAWTARGNRAVVLHMKDGTRLYIGTDHPQGLEERIRAVAGTRIGPDPVGNPRGA